MVLSGIRGEKRGGDAGEGPAVIEERETSIVIGPDAHFRVDVEYNLIIELDG